MEEHKAKDKKEDEAETGILIDDEDDDFEEFEEDGIYRINRSIHFLWYSLDMDQNDIEENLDVKLW